MKKIIAVMLISTFSLMTINACSTMEGAGKDIQKAGAAISKKAKKK